jgi:hypothetical protein
MLVALGSQSPWFVHGPATHVPLAASHVYALVPHNSQASGFGGGCVQEHSLGQVQSLPHVREPPPHIIGVPGTHSPLSMHAPNFHVPLMASQLATWCPHCSQLLSSGFSPLQLHVVGQRQSLLQVRVPAPPAPQSPGSPALHSPSLRHMPYFHAPLAASQLAT